MIAQDRKGGICISAVGHAGAVAAGKFSPMAKRAKRRERCERTGAPAPAGQPSQANPLFERPLPRHRTPTPVIARLDRAIHAASQNARVGARSQQGDGTIKLCHDGDGGRSRHHLPPSLPTLHPVTAHTPPHHRPHPPRQRTHPTSSSPDLIGRSTRQARTPTSEPDDGKGMAQSSWAMTGSWGVADRRPALAARTKRRPAPIHAGRPPHLRGAVRTGGATHEAYGITGVICGDRVEALKGVTRDARRMDKVVDELAKGRGVWRVMRVG